MLARLCGLLRSGAEYVRMAKVRTHFKPGPTRHFIRQWRKHRGYTQEQLAEILGVTHGAISQLETGRMNYTQPMLEAMAEALSCEPADLIMRDPESPIWSIMDNLKSMTPEQQAQVSEIVSTFKRAG